MKIGLLALSIFLAGCSAAHEVASVGCDDSLRMAVLKNLDGKIDKRINGLTAWLEPTTAQQRVDAAQVQINMVREWAKSVEDRCVRAEYNHWLDYFQGELDSAREEIRTHALRDEQIEFRRKSEAEMLKATEKAQQIPKP